MEIRKENVQLMPSIQEKIFLKVINHTQMLQINSTEFDTYHVTEQKQCKHIEIIYSVILYGMLS